MDEESSNGADEAIVVLGGLIGECQPAKRMLNDALSDYSKANPRPSMRKHTKTLPELVPYLKKFAPSWLVNRVAEADYSEEVNRIKDAISASKKGPQAQQVSAALFAWLIVAERSWRSTRQPKGVALAIYQTLRTEGSLQELPGFPSDVAVLPPKDPPSLDKSIESGSTGRMSGSSDDGRKQQNHFLTRYLRERRRRKHRSPSDLLFNRMRTNFVGREETVGELLEFLDAEDRFLWWQIAGELGQGKRRLALQLADFVVAESGWHSGFVTQFDSSSLKAIRELASKKSVLLIVNDLNNMERIDWVADCFNAIDAALADSSVFPNKVRLLLLDSVPYDLTQDDPPLARASRRPWQERLLSNACIDAADLTSEYAFRRTAAVIADLTREELIEVATGYVREVYGRSFSDAELDELRAIFAQGKQSPFLSSRTFYQPLPHRPLFAMMAAENIVNGYVAGGGTQPSLENQLDFFVTRRVQSAFDRENSPFLDIIDIETKESEQNLAYLAAIVSALPRSQIPNKTNEAGIEYTQDVDGLLQTFRIMGSVTAKAHTRALHTIKYELPELFGQYLVISAFYHPADRFLRGNASEGDEAQLKRFGKIIDAAWKLNPSGMTRFGIGVITTFPVHPVGELILRRVPRRGRAGRSWCRLVAMAVCHFAAQLNHGRAFQLLGLLSSEYYNLENFEEVLVSVSSAATAVACSSPSELDDAELCDVCNFLGRLLNTQPANKLIRYQYATSIAHAVVLFNRRDNIALADRWAVRLAALLKEFPTDIQFLNISLWMSVENVRVFSSKGALGVAAEYQEILESALEKRPHHTDTIQFFAIATGMMVKACINRSCTSAALQFLLDLRRTVRRYPSDRLVKRFYCEPLADICNAYIVSGKTEKAVLYANKLIALSRMPPFDLKPFSYVAETQFGLFHLHRRQEDGTRVQRAYRQLQQIASEARERFPSSSPPGFGKFWAMMIQIQIEDYLASSDEASAEHILRDYQKLAALIDPSMDWLKVQIDSVGTLFINDLQNGRNALADKRAPELLHLVDQYNGPLPEWFHQIFGE